ncbi:MAG: four helix bundle protein [Rikenellaceae bacterium]|nr:four helix bundle protein [Rikenellaceae bacterium]
MKSDNLIEDKSFDFAVRIVNLYKHLQDEHRENVMSKQVLRCGTSIGANIKEAMHAQSRKDFISKMNIALKESYETEYWLRLLYKADYITDVEFKSIYTENQDISNIIAKIIITSKSATEEW